ncbi:MAG: hypothetical protein RR525_10905 [Cellulosilyticaceae bacterium]
MAYKNSIPRERRIILGCRAICGENISRLARESNSSRQFIYDQKEKVQGLLGREFDTDLHHSPTLTVNQSLIQQIIFGCMVICKASLEDVQEFIQTILNIHVSIGSISNCINELARRAKRFNDSVPLEAVKVGAHDEIFQSNQAVLVGVEPHSTYIYLCEGSKSRDSTAWGCALLDKQEQGLNIELSVNDGGTGLIKGIQEVYPDAKIQSDIFHAEKKLSDYMYRAERVAYKAIAVEYRLKTKLLKAHGFKKEKYTTEYNLAASKSIEAIRYYDILFILYNWLREVFQIGGYSYNERTTMLEIIISEIKSLTNSHPKLQEVVTYLAVNQSSLLEFVREVNEKLKEFSEEEKIDLESLSMMWEQLKFPIASEQYNILEIQLVNRLMEKYDEVRTKFQAFSKSNIIRASSIVECINSLIRPYLTLKRAVYTNFLPLMQFYFNTRTYRRSRRKHRAGKRPIELLTHKEYPSPLELLQI